MKHDPNPESEFFVNIFKLILSFSTAASLIVTSIGNVMACTSLVITDTNGNVYHGRTLENSTRPPALLTYMPAGTKIESATPTGQQGMVFSTKYAFIGAGSAKGYGVKQQLFLDGLNDQGLSLSGNELNPSTSMSSLGSDNSRILSGQLFSTWVLGNFKTVDEVKKVLSGGAVRIWLPDVKLFDSLPVPLHYAIHDKSGGAIVIEFTDGMANIYDNPVNVLTNGPHFPWHLENLNNYTFNNVDKNTGQLGKLKLATADSGIAMTSLPAANTSQARFVKAAFYANYVKKGTTPDQAINQLGHIMNNFDRPEGFTIDAAGSVGDGPSSNKASSEVSVFTVMKDLSRGKYYMRSINNSLNWAVVDLASLKDVKEVKAVSAYEINNAGAQNASASFMK